jgi:hypothetical protein
MLTTQSLIQKSPLRDEVQHLAETAFHKKLISGYGDGEYSDKYQITYQGKTKHFLLEDAQAFLNDLLKHSA